MKHGRLLHLAVVLVVAAAIPSPVVASGRSEGPAGISASHLASLPELPAFPELVQAARGTTVAFHMWGGSEAVNRWMDQFVIPRMQEQYGISVRRIPMDAPVFVSRLQAERRADRTTGTMDLLWINGENFRTARQQELLFGPFASALPNFTAWVDPALAERDAGYPVEGYAVPWGQAQFNFDVDVARVTRVPAGFADLRQWVREHPGRFTYPEPTDFTGSAFLRQAFFALTGGHEQYLQRFDPQLLDRNAPLLWEYLNDIAPYLWQEGQSYPRDLAALDALFQRGEVDISMSFSQTNAATRVAQGRYPPTVRSFLMEEGSVRNTHAVAIPYNAPNAAGALVLADFLLSPEAQYSKNQVENWGDFTVLTVSRLPDEMRRRFAALDFGAATVSLAEFERLGIPEVPSEYWEALERGWETEVRGR
jgi:putative spermidine/putrescine transport system substrate-binding protein